jgi:hypothetical protein
MHQSGMRIVAVVVVWARAVEKKKGRIEKMFEVSMIAMMWKKTRW